MDPAALLALADQPVWGAPAHAATTPWWLLYCVICRGIVLTMLGFLLLRALIRHRRYNALDQVRAADVDELTDVVRAAERRTSGEIVVVVLERSDRFPGANWLAGFVFFVAGTVTAMPWLPWHDPVLTLATQLALFCLGFALTALLPDLKRFFVGAARATEMAEEQALQEFQRLRLHETQGNTGVLVFVSLFERCAVVLGDTGVAAKVDPQLWGNATRALLDGIGRGSLKKGLADAVRIVADVLAVHFPSVTSDRDELPNLVVVRRE
ncbi:MAG: hypothetical protein IPH13_00950 [Planctomycetes bacterium]|nr:hypothetical protein [Planctomycetota bacterium]MCC7172570.1 hypothetical protein [Planctomycetota bacterium]